MTGRLRKRASKVKSAVLPTVHDNRANNWDVTQATRTRTRSFKVSRRALQCAITHNRNVASNLRWRPLRTQTNLVTTRFRTSSRTHFRPRRGRRGSALHQPQIGVAQTRNYPRRPDQTRRQLALAHTERDQDHRWLKDRDIHQRGQDMPNEQGSGQDRVHNQAGQLRARVPSEVAACRALLHQSVQSGES